VNAERSTDPSLRREKRQHLVVSIEDVEESFKGIATPIKDKVLAALKEKDNIGAISNVVLDEFLDEVSRRVYGFAVDELSSDERKEIQRIKNSFFGE
jgi:hypothetical protein